MHRAPMFYKQYMIYILCNNERTAISPFAILTFINVYFDYSRLNAGSLMVRIAKQKPSKKKYHGYFLKAFLTLFFFRHFGVSPT